MQEASNLVALKHGDKYKVFVRNNRKTRARFTLTIDGKKQGVWVLKPHQSATIERPASVAKQFTFFKEGTSEAAAAGISSGAFENGVVRCDFVAEQQTITPLPRYVPPHHHHWGGGWRGRGDGGGWGGEPHCWGEEEFDADTFGESFYTAQMSFRGTGAAPESSCRRAAGRDRCRGAGFGSAAPPAPPAPPAAATASLGSRGACKKKSKCMARDGGSRGLSAGATGLQGTSSQSFGSTSDIVNEDPASGTTICFRLACREEGPQPVTPLPTHACPTVIEAPPRPSGGHPRHWGKPPTGVTQLKKWEEHHRAMDQATKDGRAVHRSIACDMCEEYLIGIIGSRYHLIGSDYDLCEEHFNELPPDQHTLYEVIHTPGADPVRVVPAVEEPPMYFVTELEELKQMGFDTASPEEEEAMVKLLTEHNGAVKDVVKALLAKERGEREAKQADEQRKLDDCVEMGFAREQAEAALIANEWEVKAAVKSLMAAERSQIVA